MMNDDRLRLLLFYEDLAPDEGQAAREALAEAFAEGDGEGARALRRWHAARERIEERFLEALPERRLLVLYTLATGRQDTALSEDERREVEAARPRIERAIEAHPSLETVLEDIRQARAGFDAAWQAHAPHGRGSGVEETAGAAVPARPREAPPTQRTEDTPARSRAADRAPARRTAARRWGWRVAATLALVAFATVLFFVFEREQNTITVTASGPDPRLVTLADGSTIRLMPGARLAYVSPEAALNRHATLEAGRAYFDVARSQEPFLVETPTARVQVLGTRFGVTAREQLTHVVLAFGRVGLSAKGGPGQPVTLAPGQESRVAAGARPSTPSAVEDLSDALAWTGLFVFRQAPAGRIAGALADHYDTSVEVAAALEEVEVTGTFDRSRPLRETLRTVAAALDAQLEALADGGYVLVPGGGASAGNP